MVDRPEADFWDEEPPPRRVRSRQSRLSPVAQARIGRLAGLMSIVSLLVWFISTWFALSASPGSWAFWLTFLIGGTSFVFLGTWVSVAPIREVRRQLGWRRVPPESIRQGGLAWQLGGAFFMVIGIIGIAASR